LSSVKLTFCPKILYKPLKTLDNSSNIL